MNNKQFFSKQVLCILLASLCMLSVQAQADIESGLILHYNFNENADDISGNSNHGTIISPGVYPTRDYADIENQALLFNGSYENGMIECPIDILNNLTEFSMSYWFKISNSTNAMSLVGQDNLIETGYYTSPNRIVTWHTESGSISTNITSELDEWQHFTVTCNSSEMKIYLNGILEHTISGNFALSNTTYPPCIGGNVVNQANDTFFKGAIDEVRLYNKTLTQEDINLLSAATPITINITNVSNLTPCTGSQITIDYTLIGTDIPENNKLFLQLSDAQGNFENSITLAQQESNSSGSFTNVEIPEYLSSSENYAVRISSENPFYKSDIYSENMHIINASDGLSSLAKDRILYYKFNANANDETDFEHHGSTHGGISYTTDRFGNENSAIQLNGTNGYIEVPEGVWFDGSPFTIATWIKPNAFNSWSRVMDFGIGQGNENITFALTNGTSGELYALIRRGTSTQYNVTGPEIALDEWSHVVFSFDGETIRIYLNGVLSASTTSAPPRLVSRTTNYIGKSTVSGGNYTNASYDDFMLFKRQLSEDEIKVLSNDGLVFSNTPVCTGNSLFLDAPDNSGASYEWAGPNNFTSDNKTNLIDNTTPLNSGNYYLTITNSTCIYDQAEKQILITDDASQTSVNFSGLPEESYIGAQSLTLLGNPEGGVFHGTGIQGNSFMPEQAGLGVHQIIYAYENTSGCNSTAEQNITIHPGYNMSNQTITACGGGFFDSGSGNENYNNSEDYTISFCSDNAERLQFYFSSISLAQGDTLWAYDGTDTDAELIAMYIQHSNRDHIWSSDTCLTFRFKSDDSNTASGWEAQYWCMENPEINDEITDMSSGFRTTCSGTFRDPGGSGDYPFNIIREQTFKSADGNRLHLDFNMFDLNGNNGGHWLRVYDGPSTSYPLIGSYSQWANPPSAGIESSGEYLTFRFESTVSVGVRPGWEATWSCPEPAMSEILIDDNETTTCQAVFYDHAGPANNYQPNRNDTTLICAENGALLRVSANHNETSIAAGDTLKVYDGSTTNAQLLAVFVENSRIDDIISTGNCLLFVFSSDDSNENNGWQTFVNCTEETPDQQYFNMSSGERFVCHAKFRDPGGGSNYPRGTWTQTYTSYNGSRLRLTKNMFDVNGNNGGHPFKIYDGADTDAPLIGTYTNFANPPAVIQSSGESLCFVFNSTNTSAGTTAGWDFDITCFSDEPMDVQWISSPICAGETIDIHFILNESVNTDNEFTAQLSDENGNFDSPTNIGTLISEASGTISAQIPESILAGNQYRIRVTSSNPAMISAESPNPILIYPIPDAATININGTSEICPGNERILSVPVIDGIFQNWYHNDALIAENASSILINTAGEYHVISENICGTIQSSNSINITEIDIPESPIIYTDDNTDICENEAITLYTDEIENMDFFWKLNGNAIGNNSNLLSTSEPGVYELEITNECGSSISENQITINVIGTAPQAFSINLTGDAINCAGDNPVLTADSQPNSDYQWLKNDASYGENSNSLNVTESGNYSLIIYNDCGTIESSNSITISFLNTPENFDITINGETELCQGESVTLSIPEYPEANYTWYLNDNLLSEDTNELTTTASGDYSAFIETPCGNAESINDVNISVQSPLQAFTISANGDTNLCEGENLLLSTDNQENVSYQWYHNDTETGNNMPTFEASEAGIYHLIISNFCGSLQSDNTIEISMQTAPVITNISSSNGTEFCDGDSTILSISENNTYDYQWTQNGTNIGTNNHTLSVFISGTYSVLVSNQCGSIEPDEAVTITVHDLPIVSYTQDPDSICYQQGSQTLQNASPEGGNFYGNGVSNGIIETEIAGIGTHEISYIYTDNNGCENSAVSSITILDCTTIDKLSQNDFQIFPNPAKNHLFILAAKNGKYSLQLISNDGKTIKQIKNEYLNKNSIFQFNLGQITPGNYLLKITGQSKSQLYQIVIQ